MTGFILASFHTDNLGKNDVRVAWANTVIRKGIWKEKGLDPIFLLCVTTMIEAGSFLLM